jgi:hypothetical protein
MADGKYPGTIPSKPIGAGCEQNPPRRAMQREGEANGAPSGVAHPDDDRRLEKRNKR